MSQDFMAKDTVCAMLRTATEPAALSRLPGLQADSKGAVAIVRRRCDACAMFVIVLRKMEILDLTTQI